MSAPTFLAFPLAGHYAKMGVIAFFPWIIWALERALAQRRLIYWAAGRGVDWRVYLLSSADDVTSRCWALASISYLSCTRCGRERAYRAALYSFYRCGGAGVGVGG